MTAFPETLTALGPLALAPHVIVFFSALAASVTGYGFVLLASPLLLFLLSPTESVPLSIALGWLVISVLLARRGVWQAVQRPAALQLAGSGILGIPVGTALLISLDPRVLRVLLGLTITLLAALALRALRPVQDGPVTLSTENSGGCAQ